jgi:hypothetical protein
MMDQTAVWQIVNVLIKLAFGGGKAQARLNRPYFKNKKGTNLLNVSVPLSKFK